MKATLPQYKGYQERRVKPTWEAEVKKELLKVAVLKKLLISSCIVLFFLGIVTVWIGVVAYRLVLWKGNLENTYQILRERKAFLEKEKEMLLSPLVMEQEAGKRGMKKPTQMWYLWLSARE